MLAEAKQPVAIRSGMCRSIMNRSKDSRRPARTSTVTSYVIIGLTAVGTKAMHCDGYELRRPVVNVEVRVHFTEFDHARVGQRGGEFNELYQLAGTQSQRGWCRRAGGVSGPHHVQVKPEKHAHFRAVVYELLLDHF